MAASNQTESAECVPGWVTEKLRDGIVIPAHPLALTDDGAFDRRHQRALTRYYHAAGAGGLAVAVHTTQFEIRDPKHDLLADVLTLASETAAACDAESGRQTVLIAGICGPTHQAVAEAALAKRLGYHAGLLSLAALPDADVDELIEHCRHVAEQIPLFGFYLQPAVGGRELPMQFWRRFADIPQVIGIKLAPFDRYRTLDVIRGVAASGRADNGRADQIALYTGNDDAIVTDLVTDYRVAVDGRTVELGMRGGLLGHWACWTAKAVETLGHCKQARRAGQVSSRLMTLAAEVTDCNAALFDAANGFAGCIAGIQHVLYRQGLLASPRCLNPHEKLSPGQLEEIQRVCADYPHLIDDDFVADHLQDWLRD